MKKVTKQLFSFLSCCIMTATAIAQAPSPASDANLNYFYTQAVVNSSYTATSKISKNLVIISDENHSLTDTTINGQKYYLMVSLKGDSSYYPPNAATIQPYNTKGWDLWVTASPELKEKVKNVDKKHINMRLKQLLGLPPAAEYKYFITFWVRAQDMFRPCPDNELTDNACGLCFPADADPAYKSWVDSQRLSRFFVCDTATRYPWTQLGYTYDWDPANKTHQGCSEFVIRKYSNTFMRHVYTINEYLYGTR